MIENKGLKTPSINKAYSSLFWINFLKYYLANVYTYIHHPYLPMSRRKSGLDLVVAVVLQEARLMIEDGGNSEEWEQESTWEKQKKCKKKKKNEKDRAVGCVTTVYRNSVIYFIISLNQDNKFNFKKSWYITGADSRRNLLWKLLSKKNF